MIGKQEFVTLRKQTPDAIILKYEKEILRLVQKIFKKEGEISNLVGILVGDTIKKLCSHDPLGPIYDEDGWIDHGAFYQHKRCSAVFKDKGGLPYYIEALIFQKGSTQFTGHARLGEVGTFDGPIVSSRLPIEFPFIPKRFIIDIEDIEYRKDEAKLLTGDILTPEENGGWWESWIKDPSQLIEAFEYYKYTEYDNFLAGNMQ